MTEFIEVVCADMTCFQVHPVSLEPISTSYYEPAAWSDPQGRQQISYGEWTMKRNEQREQAEREYWRKRAQEGK